MAMPQACLITIGTEITDGEILNTNAQWLSTELTNFGFNLAWQLSVPDDKVSISKAFKKAQNEVQHIFITGGLGPTSDDITRQCLANHLGCKLELNTEIQYALQSKLSKRNIAFRDGHLNQCYFPSDSAILDNPVGTAQGFYYQDGTRHYWVLPGPPIELQSVWRNSMLTRLKEFNFEKPYELHVWRCMGKGESEISHAVETILKDLNWKVGFRASYPYVIVKVWEPIDRRPKSKEKITAIDRALKPSLVKYGITDLCEYFVNSLRKGVSVQLVDSVTGGILTSRISNTLSQINLKSESSKITAPKDTTPEHLKKFKPSEDIKSMWAFISADHVEPQFSPDIADFTFALKKIGSDQWQTEVYHKGQMQNSLISGYPSLSDQTSRGRQFLAEMSVKNWITLSKPMIAAL